MIEAKSLKIVLSAALPGAMEAVGFDLTWACIIALGLLLGWAARIGSLVKVKKSFKDITNDVIYSILIGGGNGILAGIVIFALNLTYLQGLGVAFIAAFAGTKIIDTVVAAAVKKIENYKDK